MDDNILQRDSVILQTILLLHKPVGKFDLSSLIRHRKSFNGELIIQTMFLKGTLDGVPFDNSTDIEVRNWISVLKEVRPKAVMIYSIARDTPAENLIGIELAQLEAIGKRVELETGIAVQVSG